MKIEKMKAISILTRKTTIAKNVGLAVGFFFALASSIDVIAETRAGSGSGPQDRKTGHLLSAKHQSHPLKSRVLKKLVSPDRLLSRRISKLGTPSYGSRSPDHWERR